MGNRITSDGDAMVGLTFLICILLILTAVGFLFAWMVRLVSFSKNPPVEELSRENKETKTKSSV